LLKNEWTVGLQGDVEISRSTCITAVTSLNLAIGLNGDHTCDFTAVMGDYYCGNSAVMGIELAIEPR